MSGGKPNTVSAHAAREDWAEMDPADAEYYGGPPEEHHIATIYESGNNWASQFRAMFKKAGIGL
jgi:hypothetical protein